MKLAREMDEIGHGGAYPRAAGEVTRGELAEWRGAGKISQQEAVQGIAALRVRRVGVEVARGSRSSGGELTGVTNQGRSSTTRRGERGGSQQRGEMGPGRCRGGQVAAQRRCGGRWAGNPTVEETGGGEQSSGGSGGRRRG